MMIIHVLPIILLLSALYLIPIDIYAHHSVYANHTLGHIEHDDLENEFFIDTNSTLNKINKKITLGDLRDLVFKIIFITLFGILGLAVYAVKKFFTNKIFSKTKSDDGELPDTLEDRMIKRFTHVLDSRFKVLIERHKSHEKCIRRIENKLEDITDELNKHIIDASRIDAVVDNELKHMKDRVTKVEDKNNN